MGWKLIKEHYKVERQDVVITEAGVAIGTGYIRDLIVISREGQILKRYEFGSSDLIAGYQAEIERDPAKFRELLEAPDHFEQSIPVYTYKDAEIIEKFCENPGSYPSQTHDGDMMYQDSYSTDRNQVIQWAKRSVNAGIENCNHSIEDIEERLQKVKTLLAHLQDSKAKLDAMPATIPS